MRLFLTCLSSRGVVLRETPIFPATFSNLAAIWCGYRALGEVQGPQAPLPTLGVRDIRETIPVRDAPGCSPTGTER